MATVQLPNLPLQACNEALTPNYMIDSFFVIEPNLNEIKIIREEAYKILLTKGANVLLDLFK